MKRMLLLFLLSFLGAWIGSCMPKKSEDKRSGQPAAIKDTAFLPGDPKLSGFAWAKTELATCFSGRAGTQVYVWDLQKTVTCDAATKTWK